MQLGHFLALALPPDFSVLNKTDIYLVQNRKFTQVYFIITMGCD